MNPQEENMKPRKWLLTWLRTNQPGGLLVSGVTRLSIEPKMPFSAREAAPTLPATDASDGSHVADVALGTFETAVDEAVSAPNEDGVKLETYGELEMSLQQSW